MSSKKQNVGPHPGKRKNTKLNERKGEERVYKKNVYIRHHGLPPTF
ncbi:Uncharacterized protein APZ42_019182 [Daphnia magna]|uniref:Uncharacterized protein n=1 Tax=Daphnia magna TaxID=35525 RepID=A0A164YIK2_9CRUS|nr:Uncharacterized protein APZ42_019182 [Daphnia magna]